MPGLPSVAVGVSESIPLQRALRRDRAIVILGLVGVTALSWVYTVSLVREMLAAHLSLLGGFDFVPLLLMWVIMMVAMMAPSAAPCLLTLANANRDGRQRQGPIALTTLFLSGDLLVWTGFALLAALAQWRLHSVALIGPRMASTSAILNGALLLAAGVFQFTPMKKACLKRCRAPLEDREGHCGPPDPLTFGGGPCGPPNPLASAVPGSRDRPWGALLMGLTHGAFSAGSCSALMLVLFVTGVMSVPWMAILTGFLVLEKVAPERLWISRVAGALLAAWGGWILFGVLA